MHFAEIIHSLRKNESISISIDDSDVVSLTASCRRPNKKTVHTKYCFLLDMIASDVREYILQMAFEELLKNLRSDDSDTSDTLESRPESDSII